MTRFVLKGESEGMQAILTQVTEDHPVDDRQPLILDIDVFEVAPFPLDPSAVLEKLPALRKWKNFIFFEAITEEALKIFA